MLQKTFLPKEDIGPSRVTIENCLKCDAKLDIIDADLCDDCAATYGVCEGCCDVTSRDDLHPVDGSDDPTYCDDCFTKCYDCGGNFTETHEHDGHDYCEECESEYSYCERCEAWVIHIDSAFIDDEFYCEDCYHNCFDCSEPTINDFIYDNHHICESCQDNYVICDHCSETVHTNNYCSTDDGVYCQSCFDETYTYCYNCNEVERNDDIRQTDDEEWVCSHCAEDYVQCEECGLYGDDEHTCDSIPTVAPDTSSTTYSRIYSRLTFGMEIELSECPDYNKWVKKTGWRVTRDGSLPRGGREFVSPILRGDSGLKSIETFCKTAKGSVCDRCGVHLHVGVKDFSQTQLKAIAFAYHFTCNFWFRTVDESRADNRYCQKGRNDYERIKAVGVGRAQEGLTKFYWINYKSLSIKGTIEIRLHHGSLDPGRLVRWTIAHTNMMDSVSKMTPQEAIDTFSGCKDISDYINMDQGALLGWKKTSIAPCSDNSEYMTIEQRIQENNFATI